MCPNRLGQGVICSQELVYWQPLVFFAVKAILRYLPATNRCWCNVSYLQRYYCCDQKFCFMQSANYCYRRPTCHKGACEARRRSSRRRSDKETRDLICLSTLPRLLDLLRHIRSVWQILREAEAAIREHVLLCCLYLLLMDELK